MTTTTKPVSILDLPIRYLAQVERMSGARMTEWPAGVESVAELYALILAAGMAVEQGRDPDAIQEIYDEDTGQRSIGELQQLVELGSDEDQETVDPT